MQEEVGRSDMRTVAVLVAEGHESVPASGANAVFGLRGDAGIYMCFLADTPELQSERQARILAVLSGDAEDREVPNIPLVCVLTE
ncbi:hypothetical protein [Roseivivax marinus]|nr:hypothetical protein [Roseivivax marinus]